MTIKESGIGEICCAACGTHFRYDVKHAGKTTKCKRCGETVILTDPAWAETELPEQSERLSCLLSWSTSIVVHVIIFLVLGGVTWMPGLGKGKTPRKVRIVMEEATPIQSSNMSIQSVASSLPEISLLDPLPEQESTNIESFDSYASDSGLDELIDRQLSIGNESIHVDESIDEFLSISGGFGALAVFFELEAKGQKIIYIIDCSYSMEGKRLESAKWELQKSIYDLQEAMEFYVIFYNDVEIPMEPQKFYKATTNNKGKCIEWANEIIAEKNTDPTGALDIAYDLKPDAMFLLSDGIFNDPRKVMNFITKKHGQYRIPIHTVGFFYEAEELRLIADLTKGSYRHWTE